MIKIDGSKGGGQLLRTALSLSAVTGKPFKINEIRGLREKEGLQKQHLTAVNAIANVCNADVMGNELHSKEIEFIPNKINWGHYSFDIGTAGSTMLVLQTLLPALLMEKKESIIEIKGGTANPMAVPAYDFKNVFLWYLNKMGVDAEFSVEKHGFYPVGGGKIIIRVKPCYNLKKLNVLERGNFIGVNVYSVAANQLKNKRVAERLIEGFKSKLDAKFNVGYVDTLSPGCFIHAYAEYENCRLGFTKLGELNVRAEDIGRECADGLLFEMNSKATVDHFTADQLLIYIALAKGGSFVVSKVTNHIKTNIEVIEKFLDVKFAIRQNIIECRYNL